MTLAVNALHKGIYDRLVIRIGSNVYSHIPQASAFPYVVIGEKTSIPFRTKTGDGQEITVTLHAWTQGSGDKACADLMQSVYRALDRQENAVDVEGYDLTEITCEFNQLLPDTGDEAEPDRYYHGVMRFRAIVQEQEFPGSEFLLESGYGLLLETGDNLLMEA
ncbi:DUF3168 domain-containing protein [Tautonia plasticadhaerens]|uniref:Uncharacterized protein n=1 Tax=Tautonia plasticadhaerens TaxID=2527974 RepID=A0A518H245_9BACT|nr:DUF3168 domain-containing protein [Tautonia plasticadhaerens]QDV34905.1 hypothetical protein ElP_28020 [Tautonia plasticadhaerens]